jgi:hypothetical protein
MPTRATPSLSLLVRFNQAFEKSLLHLWPQEKKLWGAALVSELSVIDSPWKKFFWLLGGISVLARESLHSFLNSLRRPIGSPQFDPAAPLQSPSGRNPRAPRFVLVLLALVFAWIFWQPQTRAVFRSVSQSYTQEGWNSSHWPEVRRIQSLAEKSQDPQLLAFASLLFRDASKREALLDAAIARDPSLVWVDYQNAMPDQFHALSAVRIDRLLAADRGNAVLYFLRAEAIAVSYRQQDAQADPNANDIAHWGSKASQDPRWLAAMNAAFSAPRYDPYDNKLFRLAQDVMRRYSINDPRILTSMLRHRTFYPYLASRAYNKVLLSNAAEAQRSGNYALAIQDCSLILDFAQRLRAGKFFRLAVWTANDLELQTYPLLQSLYENSGRHADALAVAASLRQTNDERVSFTSPIPRASVHGFLHWSRAQWAAVLMQASVLAIWILLPLSPLSIVLLLAFRQHLRGTARSLASLFADLCPVLLVLSCLVLFLAYAPYDHAYRQMLQDSASTIQYEQFGKAAYAPFALPFAVRTALDSLSGPQGQFLAWSALIVILVALLVLISLRNVLRLRRTN